MHWNTAQATVLPFACYYRQIKDSGIQPLNLVVISDCLDHNTTAENSFQKSLIPSLKSKITGPQKMIYFTHGLAAQYKNRFNVSNLLQHEEDLNVSAEWHFFATSHGKGPSDGLGRTLKRMAARANLQRPVADQITTLLELN